MWRGRFLALATALEVLVVASVFATGHSEQSSSAAEPMALTFWNGFTAADGEALRGIVKRWNAEKPGINIEMSVLVWATFYDKLTASIAAGRGPDLVAFHYERIPEYASRGQLLPLDDYMRVLGLKPSDFVEIPWGGGMYKGKRYSVPLDWMPQIGLYYNKDHYKEVGLDPEKPPTTLDAFVDYNKKLKTDNRWGYMVSRGPSLARLFLSMIYQHGSDLLNEDQSKSVVNTPAGLASAKILHDFIYRYQIAPKDTAMNEEITAFKAGTVTHVLNHLAYSNDFLGQSGLRFGYAQIPVFGTKQAVLANSHQLSIPMPQKVDKKKIEATLSFVHWLLADRGIDWAAAGQLPVRKDLLAAAEFRQRFPIHQAQMAMAPNLHFPAKTTKWGEVYSRLDPNLQGLLLGQVAPEQAVAAMAKEMDEILAK
jgi:multiple sugar transport system substrate-binding protein